MSKSQWMHIELYSRSGTLNKSTKSSKTSISGVVNEAIRTPGYVSHIVADGGTPAPPNYIYSLNGKSLDEHMVGFLEQVEHECDGLGRKIRADKNILLAGTASYPRPIKADSWDSDEKHNYILWREQTLKFLQSKFSENLICVLEHNDEAYPHLHFYAVNRTKVAATPELHPGYASTIALEKQAKAEGKGRNPKELTNAYRAAMRQFQDDYYAQVSVYCGFDRLGPRAQRMNRTEWKARKQANKKMREVVRRLKEEAKNVQDRGEKLEQLAHQLDEQMAENQAWETKLEQEARALQAGTKDLELAEYVKAKHKEIVVQFNIQRLRQQPTATRKSSLTI